MELLNISNLLTSPMGGRRRGRTKCEVADRRSLEHCLRYFKFLLEMLVKFAFNGRRAQMGILHWTLPQNYGYLPETKRRGPCQTTKACFITTRFCTNRWNKPLTVSSCMAENWGRTGWASKYYWQVVLTSKLPLENEWKADVLLGFKICRGITLKKKN